jgi:2-haloacid dehalogenase
MIREGIQDVRALAFDVFGTVVDWRSGVARAAQGVLGPYGVETDWGYFADRWRARYEPSMAKVRNGDRSWVKLDVLHRENLVEVLNEFGIDHVEAADTDRLNLAWHRLDPWPDVLGGMHRLKRRYLLAAHSNGNVALLVNLARYAGLPWDVILGAEVCGFYKPDPQSYLRLADLLGLPPSACMMVAAHGSDLRAAAGCGLRTAFVRRPREHGQGPREQVDPTDPFELVVDSFEELADRLEG